MEYRKGILKTKTKAFAVRVVKLYQYLSQTENEHIMSKELLRSGTAIGALQREGEYAESKLDFINMLLRRKNVTSLFIGWSYFMKLRI